MSTRNASALMRTLPEVLTETLSTYLAIYLPYSVKEQREAVARMIELRNTALMLIDEMRDEDPEALVEVLDAHLMQASEVLSLREQLDDGELADLEGELRTKLRDHIGEYSSRRERVEKLIARRNPETSGVLTLVRFGA